MNWRSRWMEIAPCEAKILRERLDRIVARWPLSAFHDDAVVEIDGAMRAEESLNICFSAEGIGYSDPALPNELQELLLTLGYGLAR